MSDDVGDATYFVGHCRSYDVSASGIGVVHQIQTDWQDELLVLLAKTFNHNLHQLQIILRGPQKFLGNTSEILVLNMGLKQSHLFLKGNLVVFLIDHIHPLFRVAIYIPLLR